MPDRGIPRWTVGIDEHSTDARGATGDMNAYDELCARGEVGPASMRLVSQIVESVARKFPVLKPSGGWSDDAFEDLSQQFLAVKHAKIPEALATVDDLESLTRYVRSMVRNFLVDEARRTPRGRVRRKVEELLTQGSAYRQVGDLWQHLDDDSVYGGDIKALIQAAFAVRVAIKVWIGERDAPMASDGDLHRVLEAVFVAAGGRLSAADLEEVFIKRFGYAVRLADAELDEEDHAPESSAAERPEVTVETEEHAAEIWDALSPVERRLLPVLDDSIGARMSATGKGRSQTFVLTDQIKARLREVLAQDEKGLRVLRLLTYWCVVGRKTEVRRSSPVTGPSAGTEGER